MNLIQRRQLINAVAVVLALVDMSLKSSLARATHVTLTFASGNPPIVM